MIKPYVWIIEDDSGVYNGIMDYFDFSTLDKQHKKKDCTHYFLKIINSDKEARTFIANREFVPHIIFLDLRLVPYDQDRSSEIKALSGTSLLKLIDSDQAFKDTIIFIYTAAPFTDELLANYIKSFEILKRQDKKLSKYFPDDSKERILTAKPDMAMMERKINLILENTLF